MKFETLGAAYLGADDEAGNIVAGIVSRLSITKEEGRAYLEALRQNPSLNKELSNFVRKLTDQKPYQETFADANGILTLPLLLFNDLLISDKSKTFKVKGIFQDNPLILLKLESVDNVNEEIFVVACLTKNGKFRLTGFSKHISHDKS